MKKIYFLLFLLCFCSHQIYSQIKLSVYSEISIITAGPGSELYEAFGHSAIRIKDPVLRLDLIYNYGIFDFNAPNFYTNFTKGKLLYKLARYDFKYFLAGYNKDKRWVKQQVLNLSQEEKTQFFMLLEKNAMPENATYFYDPYFNNCATKLRDITESVLGDQVIFSNPKINQNQSFRQLMGKEIPWNTWGSLGINIALGNTLDKIANLKEQMYLPDYVFTTFKESERTINNKIEKLVKREDTLIQHKEIEQKILFLNPLLIFSLIAILGLYLTFSDFKKRTRTKYIDFVLFLFTGIVGVLIVFLWFFTDHSTTSNNFNFLWAFAPNLIVAFLFLKNEPKKWLLTYIKILLILLLVLAVLWLFHVQLFPIALIPFLIFMFIRLLFLSNKAFYKS